MHLVKHRDNYKYRANQGDALKKNQTNGGLK
jgi:hypothetical protein